MVELGNILGKSGLNGRDGFGRYIIISIIIIIILIIYFYFFLGRRSGVSFII